MRALLLVDLLTVKVEMLSEHLNSVKPPHLLFCYCPLLKTRIKHPEFNITLPLLSTTYRKLSTWNVASGRALTFFTWVSLNVMIAVNSDILSKFSCFTSLWSFVIGRTMPRDWVWVLKLGFKMNKRRKKSVVQLVECLSTMKEALHRIPSFTEPEMVAPSTQDLEAGDQRFKVILGYRESLKLPWSICDSVKNSNNSSSSGSSSKTEKINKSSLQTKCGLVRFFSQEFLED